MSEADVLTEAPSTVTSDCYHLNKIGYSLKNFNLDHLTFVLDDNLVRSSVQRSVITRFQSDQEVSSFDDVAQHNILHSGRIIQELFQLLTS